VKTNIQLDTARTVRLLRFSVIAVGSVFGLTALVLGGTAVYSNNRAASEQARVKAIENDIVGVRRILDDARSKAAISIRTQSKSVADFQESVSNLAANNSCKLSEFIASTDFQPYLSRFTKTNESTGWNQVDTQITLTGPSRNVSEVIAKFAEQPVPVEFSTVQINREKVDGSGCEVKAKIQLRILVKSGGGV
jgi:hypothetical protein